MLEETQRKGTSTELHCILDFTDLGYRCLKAVDESSKYDVVVDLGKGRFIRIQCKTSSWVTDTKDPETAFAISLRSATTNTKKTTYHKYSKDDIDYFYTWFRGQGYLVPIQEATGTSFRWRYEYPSNNQKQGIHIAAEYTVEEALKTI